MVPVGKHPFSDHWVSRNLLTSLMKIYGIFSWVWAGLYWRWPEVEWWAGVGTFLWSAGARPCSTAGSTTSATERSVDIIWNHQIDILNSNAFYWAEIICYCKKFLKLLQFTLFTFSIVNFLEEGKDAFVLKVQISIIFLNDEKGPFKTFWFIENFKIYFDKNLEPNQINKKIMIIFFERLIFFCYG